MRIIVKPHYEIHIGWEFIIPKFKSMVTQNMRYPHNYYRIRHLQFLGFYYWSIYKI